MMESGRQDYLCDVLVNDISKHSIHCPKVVQGAAGIVKLPLVVFSESNLQQLSR